MFDDLLTKHAALKASKKLEAQDFATQHCEDGLANAAAMVAHYKTELNEKNALIASLQAQVETIPSQQAAAAQEKTKQETLTRAMQTQIENLKKKRQTPGQ